MRDTTAVRFPTSVTRWLAPPVPLAQSQRTLLKGLAVVALVVGYQGSITSASLTFAAEQWGATAAAQSRSLAVIRADILLALIIVRSADRVGRRRLLLLCATFGPVFTALCALTTGIVQFTALQIVARAFVTAAAILIAVLGVESLPAEARAWASGSLVIAAAVGSGLTLVALPLADASRSSWRLLYLVPLLALPTVPGVARRVVESERFERNVGQRRAELDSTLRALAGHWRRFAAMGLFLFLVAFEGSPSRQLQNDFLRRERGFSAVAIAVFGLATNAPGLIGLIVGGRMADRVGRKRVLTVAMIAFAVGDAGLYLTHGPAQWGFSVFGALIGGASLPALGIYTAELFPTAMRSTANGVTAGLSRLGGVLGLLFVGAISRPDHIGGAVALTTAALWISVVVLHLLVPETAHRELEELNPEDVPFSASPG